MLLLMAVSRFLLLLFCIIAIFTQHVASDQRTPPGRWLAAWTAMPQLTEPANLPPAPFNATSENGGIVFRNTTVRQTIRVTAASTRLRLRLSNAFGLTPLAITAVTVAKPLALSTPASPNNLGPGSPAVDVSTLRTLTFSGSAGYTVPNGALAVSDAVDVDVAAGDVLSISVYLAEGQAGGAITSHPGSRTTSWLASGDQTASGNLISTGEDVAIVAHWYFISTLDAWVTTTTTTTTTPSSSPDAAGGAGTLAIVGDSITDGRGSTTDANDRWPDALLDRLQQHSTNASAPLLARGVAIANQAAGGNRVLADGLGPNALGRFDRDVLAQPGVRYALVFEGVNDIGSAANDEAVQHAVSDRLIAAYRQFALRAHAAGLPLFGATITPFSAPGFDVSAQPYSGAERERTRQRVNEFVRNSGGAFDAVVDFDAAVRDQEDGTRLRAEYDSGDYLHLNPAGYRAMAEAFPVDALVRLAGGVDGYA